ncbi:MAG: CHAT domain-containing protein [Leptolyngbya sp. SIO1E4]|nr:CHAT domain-containing protein [Leptolyngbya sp. SIO1E4]
MPTSKWPLSLLLSACLTWGTTALPLQAQTESDRISEATQLLETAQQRMSQGDWQGAIAPLESALSLYQQLGQSELAQVTAALLWQVYEGQGITQMQITDWEGALETYQRQQEIADLLQDPNLQAASQISLGSAALQAERWEVSREALLTGLDRARTIPSSLLLERGLALLLAAETSLGNLDGAITAGEELLSIADNPASQFQALQGLGSAYFYQGNYDRALQYHQQTQTLAAQFGEPYFQAIALANVGETQLALENTATAISLLSESLALAEVADPVLAGVVKGTLGKAYAVASDFDNALPLLAASVQQEAADGSPSGQAVALTNLGNARFLAGDLTGAEVALRQAVDFWTRQQAEVMTPNFAVSLFDMQLTTYRTLQQVLVAQGQPEAALVVAEQGRSQVLAQQLASHETTAPSALDLATLQQVAQTHNVTLVEYTLIPRNTEIFIPNRVDNRWLNAANDLYIWVVKPTGEIAFTQVPLDAADRDLANAVISTRTAIGARGRAGAPPRPRDSDAIVDLDTQLRQLHSLLVEPIAPYLPEDPAAPVVFVPQESLFLVPFAALKDDQGRYLIERHTVLTAPSIQVLQLTDARSETQDFASLQGESSVIVGNPTMPDLLDLPLASLPGAETEATAIATRLQTQPLIGAAATESAVREQLPTAKIIHLATHGLLDYGDPSAEIPGAITLAPDAVHDGLLTATELAAIPLQADLLVLSACDTGQGSITGDGVVGLSRAAIAAGVPQVVVSLWAVPDQPTAQLMTAFYDELAQGQGTAQALRQAMLTTMQSHPDPQAWAAFTAIGLD